MRGLSDIFSLTTSSANPMSQRKIGFDTFVWLVLLLVGLGIMRSAIATRLDGFTLDEAYHIAAGVSYVKYRDFRINPEHPPLVKLWVGSVIAATGFELEPLRQFSDKPDERAFTQSAVFQKNDPDSVQRRARAAMFVLNGLLLVSLAFALRRVFDARVALGALLFLVIDPTVAAHWPVVMTDLPVALLSATAIVLATRAFRDWIWTDLAACSLFLGLALAAKHSAPVVLLSVALIGMWLAFWRPIPASRRFERPKIAEDGSGPGGSDGHFVGILLFSIRRDACRTGIIQSPARGQDQGREYSFLPFCPCGNGRNPYRATGLSLGFCGHGPRGDGRAAGSPTDLWATVCAKGSEVFFPGDDRHEIADRIECLEPARPDFVFCAQIASGVEYSGGRHSCCGNFVFARSGNGSDVCRHPTCVAGSCSAIDLRWPFRGESDWLRIHEA